MNVDRRFANRCEQLGVDFTSRNTLAASKLALADGESAPPSQLTVPYEGAPKPGQAQPVPTWVLGGATHV